MAAANLTVPVRRVKIGQPAAPWISHASTSVGVRYALLVGLEDAFTVFGGVGDLKMPGSLDAPADAVAALTRTPHDLKFAHLDR